ncbi:unnamed protein product [Sphagnum jensenii]|uniref:Uncharacterized protein n=1 Tax=Sphagnum jensenii TaxID=128206 RepID=A0ABP1ASG5_9BRYO
MQSANRFEEIFAGACDGVANESAELQLVRYNNTDVLVMTTPVARTDIHFTGDQFVLNTVSNELKQMLSGGGSNEDTTAVAWDSTAAC